MALVCDSTAAIGSREASGEWLVARGHLGKEATLVESWVLMVKWGVVLRSISPEASLGPAASRKSERGRELEGGVRMKHGVGVILES